MLKLKGENYLLKLEDTLVILYFYFILSFFVFGEYFLQPFFSVSIVFLVVKYGFLIFKNKNNHVILDRVDGENILIYKNGKKIINDMGLLIKSQKGRFNLAYHNGNFFEDIVIGVSGKNHRKILEYIKKNDIKYFVEKKIKENKTKKIYFILLSIIIIFIYISYSNHLQKRYGEEFIKPEKYEYNYKKSNDSSIYRARNIILNLPSSIIMTIDSYGNEVFLDTNTRDKIAVYTKKSIFQDNNIVIQWILENAIGLKDNYSVVKKSINSKFGLFYKTVKINLNKEVRKIYCIEKEECVIYITPIEIPENSVTIIKVFNLKKHEEINIYVETESDNSEEYALKIAESIVVF